MKRFLVIGLVVLVVGLLVAGFTLPTLAHGPEDEDAPVNQEAWEAMHEACENGDWQAMAEAAEEAHGADVDYMPGYNENGYESANGWGNMGGGMMGNGWGSMGGGMMGGW